MEIDPDCRGVLEEEANRIDNVFDWIYPISIVVGAVVLYVLFFLVSVE